MIVDKTVCIADDEDIKTVKFVNKGLLKTMSAGGTIKVEEKNVNPYNYKPVCNLLIGTNPPLDFGDITAAMRRRFVVLNFNATFSDELGNKIDGMEKKLCTDKNLNYIFSKAMYYFSKVLNNKNKFNITAQIKQDTDEFLEENSIVKEFLDWWTENGRELEVETRTLYNSYVSWCIDNHENADAFNIFGTQIKALCLKAGIDEKHYKVRLGTAKKAHYHLPGYVEGTHYSPNITTDDIYKLIKNDEDYTVLYDFVNNEYEAFSINKLDFELLELLENNREFRNHWPYGIVGVVSNYVYTSSMNKT